MKIRIATPKDKKESLVIARNLKEWFNKEGLKNMKIDFEINNLVIVADKNRVVGFLCYSSENGKIKILWVGIRRESHRKGVGKFLLNWLEKESKKYELKIIEVETLTDKDSYAPYKDTREFYFKNGFKKVGYKKSKIKRHDDMVILEKKID